MGRKSRLFAHSLWSPDSRFAELEGEMAESLRPFTQIFPFCGDYRRRRVRSGLPPDLGTRFLARSPLTIARNPEPLIWTSARWTCKGPPSAQHEFATYSAQERRWRINLEYLRCDGLREYRRGNQCLDVEFVAAGSRVRLARKQYRDCGF